MRSLFASTAVLMLILASPSGLWSGAPPLSPVFINADFTKIQLGSHTELLHDPTNELTLSQVTGPPWSGSFTPRHSDSFSYGLDSSSYWFRFRLTKDPNVTEFPPLYLAVTRVIVPEIDVYVPTCTGEEKAFRHLSVGFNDMRTNDDLGHRIRVAALPRDLCSDAYIYVRVRSKVVCYGLTLFGMKAFDEYTRFEFLFFGLTTGVMLAMFLYNLAIAVFLLDRTYASYCAYLAAAIVYTSLLNGWPLGVGLSPEFLLDYVLKFYAVAFFLGLLFSKFFLETKERHPLINHVFTGGMWLMAVNMALSTAGWFDVANAMAYMMGVTLPIVMATCAAVLWYKGFYPARYYLAAWTVALGSIMIYASSGLGWLPHTFLINNMVSVGTAAESLLLSIALADRIRMLRAEKSRLKEKELRLTKLSITDELTGLFNKRRFTDKLPDEMDQARQSGTPLSLLIVDVDHFKRFNDTFGHAVGDLVLIELGDTIKQSVRAADSAFRHGGEEFAVILPDSDLTQATAVAERLRVNFSRRKITVEGHSNVGATISGGVTRLKDDDTVKTFFDRADQALYEAKSRGRNRVENIG